MCTCACAFVCACVRVHSRINACAFVRAFVQTYNADGCVLHCTNFPNQMAIHSDVCMETLVLVKRSHKHTHTHNHTRAHFYIGQYGFNLPHMMWMGWMKNHRLATYDCEASPVQTTLQSYRSTMSEDADLHAGIVVTDCDGNTFVVSARFNGREDFGTGDIEGPINAITVHSGTQSTWLEAELNFGDAWNAPALFSATTDRPAFVVSVSQELTNDGNLGITIRDFDGAADVCEPTKPCKNGGKPSVVNATDACECNCVGTGYQGSSCTLPAQCSAITESEADTLDGLDFCQNGGQALGTYGDCTCDCDGTGHEGSACQQCIPAKPCQNGGSAYTNSNDGTCACACKVGYEGTYCQTPIACKCEDDFCPVAEGQGYDDLSKCTVQFGCADANNGGILGTAGNSASASFLLSSKGSTAAKNSNRIVGGEQVDDATDYPWMANLLVDGYVCGGSLIAQNFILTAAHCVVGMSPSGATAYFGSLKSYDADAPVIQFGAKNVFVHPSYDASTSAYDTALIELSDPITTIEPVRLKQDPFSFESGEVNATVMGFGTTSAGGSLSDTLLEATVQLISTNDCNANYGGSITEDMLCAGVEGGGVDSCQGDSGGPMVQQEADGTYTQIGVVSWGIGCADADYPGVYASVGYQYGWIQNVSESNGK